MNTALLIIDVQNDYFEGGSNTLSGSEQASVNIGKILDQFRMKDLPVIHIQHIANRPTATFFLPDTFGAKIHSHVEPLKNEAVFIKHYPNSYRETGLKEYLEKQEITHLVICGMMTHMCVDATVRAAKDFGYNCTLIGDGCATKDLEINGNTIKAESVHHSFLAALNYFYAEVKTTEQFLKGF